MRDVRDGVCHHDDRLDGRMERQLPLATALARIGARIRPDVRPIAAVLAQLEGVDVRGRPELSGERLAWLTRRRRVRPGWGSGRAPSCRRGTSGRAAPQAVQRPPRPLPAQLLRRPYAPSRASFRGQAGSTMCPAAARTRGRRSTRAGASAGSAPRQRRRRRLGGTEGLRSNRMALLVGCVVGLGSFLLWLQLVGPQIRVVESVVGLVLGVGLGATVWWKAHGFTRRFQRPER